MRRFWAIARLTALESLRSRFVVVFALALAVAIVALAVGVQGDGTLTGQIQSFLDYSVTLTQLLIGLLTVLLAAFVTTGDIRSKTVFTTVTKPVRSLVYVTGRWFGVVLVTASMLAASMGAIHGLAHTLRQRPTKVEREKASRQLTPWEGDADRYMVDNDIFAARIEIAPDPIPAEQIADQELNELFEREGKEKIIRQYLQISLAQKAQARGDPEPTAEQIDRLAADPEIRRRALADIRKEYADMVRQGADVVGPGQLMPVQFSDLHPPSDRPMQLRYRLQAKKGQSLPGEVGIKGAWIVRRPEADGRERRGLRARSDAPDTASTIDLSPEMVTDDHRLLLAYRNDEANAADVILKPGEIRLRYAVGGFAGNVVRAGAIILVRLMFLAAVGVFCGTFISFPVACMVCLAIFLAGLMGDFTLEATKLGHLSQRDALSYVSYGITRGIFFVLPNLPIVHSPGGNLRDGLKIRWHAPDSDGGDGRTAAWTALRAAIVLTLAALIFRHRELARVQV